MSAYAHTLRYVPVREDVVQADAAELNAQKQAVESDLARRGARDRSTRRGRCRHHRRHPRAAGAAQRRGRYRHRRRPARQPSRRRLELSTYYRVPHAERARHASFPLETNVPVACAGRARPAGRRARGRRRGRRRDPAQLAEEIAEAAAEQERREQFAYERVGRGESTAGSSRSPTSAGPSTKPGSRSGSGRVPRPSRYRDFL